MAETRQNLLLLTTLRVLQFAVVSFSQPWMYYSDKSEFSLALSADFMAAQFGPTALQNELEAASFPYKKIMWDYRYFIALPYSIVLLNLLFGFIALWTRNNCEHPRTLNNRLTFSVVAIGVSGALSVTFAAIAAV